MAANSSIVRTLALASLVISGAPSWASDECDALPESWQPRSAVRALAQRNGWRVDTLKVDDGCYEVKGLDAQGRRFKAKLEPSTLQLVKLRREQGHPEREREHDRERRRD